MRRVRVVGWFLIGSGIVAGGGAGPGCSLAPKNFRAMLSPAPIVRARAVDLEQTQPAAVAMPALIGRLDDPDPVVRMTAHDHLKARSGQDFGYKPWGTPEERHAAVEQWRAWWSERAPQAAYPRDDELRRVAVQPEPRRRRKRRGAQSQGGSTAWSRPLQSPPQPSTDPNLTP